MPSFARVAPRATLLAIVVASCNNTTSSTNVTREAPPTSILVRPGAFLQGVACGDRDGNLSRYQATLLDVTDGVDEATALPSSPVVSCRQAVSFHSVEAGRLYIAQVRAFDRLDAQAKTKGSQVVVDSSGKALIAPWATTCWGYDGIDYSADGLGGTAGEGGQSGAIFTGIRAQQDTEVWLGGCDPLSGEFPPEMTGLSLEITHALGGLACGESAGEVSRFRISIPANETDSMGGAGGVGGTAGAGGAGELDSEEYACGVTITRTGLPPEARLTFDLEGFEGDDSTPTYASACRATVRKGVISPATCDPLSPVGPRLP